MTRLDKLLEKIRNNPQSVAFNDLDKILSAYGFTRRQPRSGSSHYTYSLENHRVTVPYRRPHVKVVYVKRVLDILDQLTAPTDSDTD